MMRAAVAAAAASAASGVVRARAGWLAGGRAVAGARPELLDLYCAQARTHISCMPHVAPCLPRYEGVVARRLGSPHARALTNHICRAPLGISCRPLAPRLFNGTDTRGANLEA